MDDASLFQIAEFVFGNAQLVQIQAAGFGKDQPLGGLNNMFDPL